MNPEGLVEAVRELGGLRHRVMATRARSWTAAMSLQDSLVGALAGDHLRGLVSLVPGTRTCYGAMVHGQRPHGIDTWLPPNGSEELVIGLDGVLRWGTTAVQAIDWRRVVDGDREWECGDLAPYVEAVQRVLERHLHHVRGHGVDTAKVDDVATRLARAFGYPL